MNEPKQSTHRVRRLGAFILALAGVWSMLAVCAVYVVLPFNPIRLPLVQTLQTYMWMPEGWAFFTRDPREPRTLTFAKVQDTWVSSSMAPHARPSNLFGVNRASRAQGVELGLIMEAIAVAEHTWEPCEEAIGTCLEAVPTADTLDNISPRPRLCGLVGLAQQEPVPWAWSYNRDEITMPSQVIKLKIEC